MGGQHDASAAFTPGKDWVPIVQAAGWASEPVWIGAENLAPTWIRSPDLPARSESLYRVRYPGSYFQEFQRQIFVCIFHNQHLGFIAVTRKYWHINFQITRCLVYKICFQSFCLLTDLLPLGSRGPPKKPAGPHLVRKLPTYDWIRRFITAFTKACPYPEPNPSGPCPPNPSTPGSSKWCFSLMLPHQNPVYTSPFPHTCYMCCPFQSYWFYHLNNIWWVVQNA